MRLEAIFDARAGQPAAAGAGPGPNRARKVQGSAAVHPPAAELGENEPSIVHEAGAARHGADPVLVHKSQCRCRKDRMSKGRPIELAFDAKEKVTGLEVIA